MEEVTASEPDRNLTDSDMYGFGQSLAD